jgi:PIN domain nuclease of toxin-antitoxin system
VNLLTDTHTLAWSFGDRSKLSKAAVAALSSKGNKVFVSVVNAWEIAIKVGIGRWPEMAHLLQNFESEIQTTGFEILPITIPHVRTAGTLPIAHRDPFDRLLVAQAKHEGLTLVTADPKLHGAGASLLW